MVRDAILDIYTCLITPFGIVRSSVGQRCGAGFVI